MGGIPKKKSLAMAAYGEMKSVGVGGLYVCITDFELAYKMAN